MFELAPRPPWGPYPPMEVKPGGKQWKVRLHVCLLRRSVKLFPKAAGVLTRSSALSWPRFPPFISESLRSDALKMTPRQRNFLKITFWLSVDLLDLFSCRDPIRIYRSPSTKLDDIHKLPLTIPRPTPKSKLSFYLNK